MKCLELLKHDHRIILSMLSIVEAAAMRLARGEPVSPALLEDALDFFANFAEGCHQAKEETLRVRRKTRAGHLTDRGTRKAPPDSESSTRRADHTVPALIYPLDEVFPAYRAIAGTPADRARGIELIDTVLRPAHRLAVISLLEQLGRMPAVRSESPPARRGPRIRGCRHDDCRH